MKHHLLIIVFLFCLHSLYSQSSDLHKFSEISQISTVNSFPVVYGWFHNEKNGKWITKDNEIKNIDEFSNYYVLSFYYQAKKYIAFVKEKKDKNELIINTYIVDYKLYKNLISKWEDNALIKLPVLKHHTSKIKKDQIFTDVILGINDLSDSVIKPKMNFVLQYKFFSDSTVKFLFYGISYTNDSYTLHGLSIDEKYLSLSSYIGLDDLYDKFFFKTTIKYFTDFIDSPIKKN